MTNIQDFTEAKFHCLHARAEFARQKNNKNIHCKQQLTCFGSFHMFTVSQNMTKVIRNSNKHKRTVPNILINILLSPC